MVEATELENSPLHTEGLRAIRWNIGGVELSGYERVLSSRIGWVDRFLGSGSGERESVLALEVPADVIHIVIGYAPDVFGGGMYSFEHRVIMAHYIVSCELAGGAVGWRIPSELTFDPEGNKSVVYLQAVVAYRRGVAIEEIENLTRLALGTI